jgi:hypothetical protein
MFDQSVCQDAAVAKPNLDVMLKSDANAVPGLWSNAA